MNKTTRNIVTAAVIGALYAVLTMVLAPISYGPVQCRISEVLCILPFFMPSTTWGLFFGCAIANIASAAGLPDIIFGSLATLIACLCISWCGKHNKKALACLMPVIWNGLIVGAMLTVVVAGLNPIKKLRRICRLCRRGSSRRSRCNVHCRPSAAVLAAEAEVLCRLCKQVLTKCSKNINMSLQKGC